MWTTMYKEFIDSAARTLWAYAYAEERDRLIEDLRSGELAPDYSGQTAENYVSTRGWPYSIQGVEWTDVAPPTPEYARLSAAMLLGRLEERNGVSLPVIVNAAKEADCATGACNEFSARKGATAHPDCTYPHDKCEIDIREFASDIVMMALGTGVSWFDDHEEFSLPTDQYYPKRQRTFTVPAIEFTREEEGPGC